MSEQPALYQTGQDDRALDPATLALLLPASPPAWTLLRRSADGYHCVTLDRLSVIVSLAREEDGRPWLHVSCARRDRMPTYDDLARVKRLLIGDERYAALVFPPRGVYVNLHRYCLHLFTPAVGDWPLPEFSGLIGGRRTL